MRELFFQLGVKFRKNVGLNPILINFPTCFPIISYISGRKSLIKIIAHTNTQPLFQQILRTNASKTTIIIRLMVGGSFFPKEFRSFSSRTNSAPVVFKKIGIPNPEFFGSFVGTFEIICGTDSSGTFHQTHHNSPSHHYVCRPSNDES